MSNYWLQIHLACCNVNKLWFVKVAAAVGISVITLCSKEQLPSNLWFVQTAKSRQKHCSSNLQVWHQNLILSAFQIEISQCGNSWLHRSDVYCRFSLFSCRNRISNQNSKQQTDHTRSLQRLSLAPLFVVSSIANVISDTLMRFVLESCKSENVKKFWFENTESVDVAYQMQLRSVGSILRAAIGWRIKRYCVSTKRIAPANHGDLNHRSADRYKWE